ncbi:hypothetical protein NW767_007530 [Fusarium falciforme]|nr:hypothetical protein NW767_007530 [Fusarium falciforme]
MLAHDPAPKNETKLSRYPLTQYSLVCRDWQISFERLLYRHLTLDRESLWDFEHIVCRQKCFVKHIRLNIDMEAFDRLARTRFDMTFLTHKNSKVSGTLMYLFRILNCWRPDFDCSKDVTLEITGYPRTRMAASASRLARSGRCSGPLTIPRYH